MRIKEILPCSSRTSKQEFWILDFLDYWGLWWINPKFCETVGKILIRFLDRRLAHTLKNIIHYGAEKPDIRPENLPISLPHLSSSVISAHIDSSLMYTYASKKCRQPCQRLKSCLRLSWNLEEKSTYKKLILIVSNFTEFELSFSLTQEFSSAFPFISRTRKKVGKLLIPSDLLIFSNFACQINMASDQWKSRERCNL